MLLANDSNKVVRLKTHACLPTAEHNFSETVMMMSVPVLHTIPQHCLNEVANAPCCATSLPAQPTIWGLQQLHKVVSCH